jgi:hypothetical protein
LESATELAKSRGLTPDSEETEELFARAFQIASDLKSAALIGSYDTNWLREKDISDDVVRDALALTSRADPTRLVHEIRRGGRLQISRELFEGSISRYLDSELRHPQVDALLLIAIADLEITAYLHAMVTWKPLIGARSALDLFRNNGSLLWLWFKGRLRGVLWVILTIASLLASVRYLGVPSERVTLFLSLGVIGLYLLTTVVTFPIVLAKSRTFAEERDRTLILIQAMVALFGELHAPGPLSVAHLRARFTELQRKGAVWPNSLWPLLDDLDARGVLILGSQKR